MKDLNKVLLVINESKGEMETIKFPIRENEKILSTPITALELDKRSFNALSRNKIKTIKDLLENYSRLKDLRNYGIKSYNKTMHSLCAFQYEQLKPEEKQKYLKRIVELNF